MSGLSRQSLTMAVFSLANFCQAVCVSLQAPFYPKEAEAKGATPSQYGLVFGVFELTVFIVSPFLGRNVNRLGAKRMFNMGILTTGICSVLFGLLDKINDGDLFIWLSYGIRILGAVGNASFLNATFSIIAKEFPDTVATTFASLETFFGFGLIVGPSLGGGLYQLGGFTLPFALLGLSLIISAAIAFFLLPDAYNESDEMSEERSNRGVFDALRVPAIFVAAFSILCASSAIGFLDAMLEPHLRQFGLPPFVMGLMFVVNGGTYALSAPIFGLLCDKHLSPALINALGVLLVSVAFVLIGPAPFLPLPTLLPVCILALVVQGVGIGAALVSSFALAQRKALANNFPDNLDTYGLVSGLWTSTFALGAFLGPTVAGWLMEHFGFREATLFILVFAVLVLIASFVRYVAEDVAAKRRRRGYTELNVNTDAIENDGDSGSTGYGSNEESNVAIRRGSGSVANSSASSRLEMPRRESLPFSPRGSVQSIGLLAGVTPFSLGNARHMAQDHHVHQVFTDT